MIEERFFTFQFLKGNQIFFAHQLIKCNHKIYKILSDTPIAFWNKNILTNHIIICNKYQKFEIDSFRDTIIFEGLNFLGARTFL